MAWIWSVLPILILLACPLMHLVMPKKMGSEHGKGSCCVGGGNKSRNAEAELSGLRRESQILKEEMRSIQSLMENR